MIFVHIFSFWIWCKLHISNKLGQKSGKVAKRSKITCLEHWTGLQVHDSLWLGVKGASSKKKGPVPVCTGSKRRCFIQIQSARALNSFNSTGTHKNVALLSCSSSSSLTNSLSLTPTGPLLPSCARLSGLWRHDWLCTGRFFAPPAATTQHNSGVERCGTQQDALRHNATQHGAAELHSGTYRATWVDKTEERVVGREAAVPLEPPVGATARPLDGQNLWLHRALSGEKTGRCLFRLYNS